MNAPRPEGNLMDRVGEVVRRASVLEDSGKKFDVKRFLQDVRGAVARHDLSAAETMVADAEANLTQIEARVSPSEQSEKHSFRTNVSRLRGWLFGAVRNHPFAFDLCLLTILAALVAGVLAWFQVQSYLAFRAYSLDLSDYNQALFTTAHSHQILYFTVFFPGGPGGMLSFHFSPFLFAVVPIYFFWSTIPALIVIKQVALALGALPAYGLAKAKLGSRKWAWLVGLVYLTTPLMTGIDWVSFDPEVFLPVTLLSAFYFLEIRRFQWFMVSCIVALSVMETVAFFLAIFSVIAFLASWYPYPQHREVGPRRLRKFAFWGLVASVASLGLSYLFLSVISNGGAFGSGYAQNFAVLGATSIPNVPLRALLHPTAATAAMSFDGNSKLLYVLLLFGCVAFLSLFGELKYLIPALGWMGLSMLANNPIYFAMDNHYVAYPLPFLIAGAISGIQRILRYGPLVVKRLSPVVKFQSHWKPRWNAYAIGSVLVAAVLITVAVASPLSSQPLGGLAGKPHAFITPDSHDAFLTGVISLIPSSASVLTTARLFPAVSSRMEAFVEPDDEPFLVNWSKSAPNGTSPGAWAFRGVTNWYLNMSQYVLLDFTLDSKAANSVLYFGNLSPFGVRVAAYGVYLYERDWKVGPQLWVPQTIVLPANHMVNLHNSSLSYSNTSQYGPSLYHPASGHKGNPLFSARQIVGLLPGDYKATFWWKIMAGQTGAQVSLSIAEYPALFNVSSTFNTSTQIHYGITQVIGSYSPLIPTFFQNGSKHTTVGNTTVPFQLATPGNLSMTVYEQTANMSLVLFAVVLTQTSPT